MHCAHTRTKKKIHRKLSNDCLYTSDQGDTDISILWDRLLASWNEQEFILECHRVFMYIFFLIITLYDMILKSSWYLVSRLGY